MADANGVTPLHVAALRGHVDEVNKIISESKSIEGNDILAVVEAPDKRGMTSLMCAAYCGCVPVLRLLLDNGASAEIKDSQGNLALHWAAAYGHCDAIKCLVNAYPAAVYAPSHDGLQPAELAETRKHHEAATLLHRHDGAGQRLFDAVGASDDPSVRVDTPFKEANPDLPEWLCEPWRYTDWEGRTAVHHAAFLGRWQSLRRLDHSKFDLHALDNYKRTPAHWAFLGNHPHIGEWLGDEDVLSITMKTPREMMSESAPREDGGRARSSTIESDELSDDATSGSKLPSTGTDSSVRRWFRGLSIPLADQDEYLAAFAKHGYDTVKRIAGLCDEKDEWMDLVSVIKAGHRKDISHAIKELADKLGLRDAEQASGGSVSSGGPSRGPSGSDAGGSRPTSKSDAGKGASGASAVVTKDNLGHGRFGTLRRRGGTVIRKLNEGYSISSEMWEKLAELGDHPNVMQIEALEDGKISHPFMAGVKLSQWSLDFDRSGPASDYSLAMLRTALGCALGLRHLHQGGVVHGNLSISNFLVVTGEDGSESIMITDFGFRDDRVPPRLDMLWDAPEMIASGKSPTFESDMFSMGLVLYMLVNDGESAWTSLGGSSAVEDIVKDCSDGKEIGFRYDDALGEDVTSVLKRCLSTAVSTRLDVEDLCDLLEEMEAKWGTDDAAVAASGDTSEFAEETQNPSDAPVLATPADDEHAAPISGGEGESD